MTLADRLAAGEVLHMAASVTHARRGTLRHAFRYGVDYLLLAPDHARGPALMARNRFNLLSVHDRDHGGPRGAGRGSAWAWDRLAQAGLPRAPGMVMALLTQPRILGHWFTPVSFWMVLQGDRLLAAIAEVNNTFGQRHSYICHLPGFAAIGPADAMTAAKMFHVSPFQDVQGHYRFNFALGSGRLAIRIAQLDGPNGLDAAMAGALVPLTNARVLAACLRRPGGSVRVLVLIYWHALRLKLKGARYRSLPAPPDQEIS
ncbi:DUF1365 domain-containing protein [Gemmobacter sp.]|uniref:DUF1365 domain-containing protein n=1 Tax=Gemmobacter sp. TaxID=1898957 RepID=UPI002AFF8312|nr:DUF1365 domain-containing protein [Gemmobacter sp.]